MTKSIYVAFNDLLILEILTVMCMKNKLWNRQLKVCEIYWEKAKFYHFDYSKIPKFLARSIPRKFSFPSQTKYSPPIITFVHGVNLYLRIFFQVCKKSNLPIPRIRGGEQIHGIGGNFEIFKTFCFSLLKSWRYYFDTSNN